jgi:hypothetical protein
MVLDVHDIGTAMTPSSSLTKAMNEANYNDQPMTKSRGLGFPLQLHVVLDSVETEGLDSIVSWLPDNSGFKVHCPDAFVAQVMPRFFNQSKYKSFQRQLNIWGFQRVQGGPGAGSYQHHSFVRGEPSRCCEMKRIKIKGIYKRRKTQVSILHSTIFPITRDENTMTSSRVLAEDIIIRVSHGSTPRAPAFKRCEMLEHRSSNDSPDTCSFLPSSLLREFPKEDLKYVMIGFRLGTDKCWNDSFSPVTGS